MTRETRDKLDFLDLRDLQDQLDHEEPKVSRAQLGLLVQPELEVALALPDLPELPQTLPDQQEVLGQQDQGVQSVQHLLFPDPQELQVPQAPQVDLEGLALVTPLTCSPQNPIQGMGK